MMSRVSELNSKNYDATPLGQKNQNKYVHIHIYIYILYMLFFI